MLGGYPLNCSVLHRYSIATGSQFSGSSFDNKQHAYNQNTGPGTNNAPFLFQTHKHVTL